MVVRTVLQFIDYYIILTQYLGTEHAFIHNKYKKKEFKYDQSCFRVSQLAFFKKKTNICSNEITLTPHKMNECQSLICLKKEIVFKNGICQ